MENQKPKIKVVPLVLLALFLVFWIPLVAGLIPWTSNTPPLQVINDMDNQPMARPQTETNFFPDRSTVRTPVEGTVPRDGHVYSVNTLEEAEVKNVNTLQPSDFVLARGQNRYNVYCSPCHGQQGEGDGLVVKRGQLSTPPFPVPPNLKRPETQALSDGRIFHVISKGQNIMPSYAYQIADVDRWAIVHYVRTLQGKKPQAVAAVAVNNTSTTQAEGK